MKPKSYFKHLITALFSSAAFFVDLYTPEPYESHISNDLLNLIFELFEQLGSTFAGFSFQMLVIALALSFVYRATSGHTDSDKSLHIEPVKGERLLSLFFAVMYTGGKAFAYNDSLSSLFSPKFNTIKTLILVIGFYYFYLALTRITFYLFENAHRVQNSIYKNSGTYGIINKLKEAYNKHPFLFMWCLIVIAWLPHLICRYPGALSDDTWDQLCQYFGFSEFRTNQPVIHTVTVGLFVEFGMKILNSSNAGLFIFICIQSIAMTAALSYSLLFMRRWNAPKWLMIFAVLLYTVTPYFTGNAAWVIKDYPHMIGFVLFGLTFIDIVVRKKMSFSFKEDYKTIILWIIGVSLMASYRKNGLHIYILSVAIWLLVFLVALIKKKENARITISLVIMLIAPLLIFSCLEKGIINAFDVIEVKQKDAFSLPLQQTARYYHYYGNELTEEEYEAIDDVLDFEWLYTDYHPYCSDSVKEEYHAENTQQLLRYFKVWFLMFFKHPLVYIEATWNQSYYVFMPDFDNIVYNQDVNAGIGVATDEAREYINLYIPEPLDGLAITICSMYRALNQMPVISSMNNLCLYVFLLFAISLFMRRKKIGEYRLALVPLWLSFIFIFLSPMIKDQPRYSWAIFYLMPSIAAMYIYLTNNKCTNNSGK